MAMVSNRHRCKHLCLQGRLILPRLCLWSACETCRYQMCKVEMWGDSNHISLWTPDHLTPAAKELAQQCWILLPIRRKLIDGWSSVFTSMGSDSWTTWPWESVICTSYVFFLPLFVGFRAPYSTCEVLHITYLVKKDSCFTNKQINQ